MCNFESQIDLRFMRDKTFYIDTDYQANYIDLHTSHRAELIHYAAITNLISDMFFTFL